MEKIVLVSSMEKCNKVEEDIWLKEKLISLGYNATIEAWDDESVQWDKFSIIVIKSTWKYEKKIEKYRRWLDSIKNLRVVNNLDLIYTNILKDKQIEMFKKNKIPHINTDICKTFLIAMIKIIIYKIMYKDIVIKPSISAGGNNTYIYTSNDSFNQNSIKTINKVKEVVKGILKEAGQKILIQPYINEIVNGEISLVYIDSEFQYALERHPKIFHERIPTKCKKNISEQLIEFGKIVLNKMNYSNNLFTRVDLVIVNNKPKIMEVEVIEPYLYIKKLEKNKQEKVLDTLARQIIRRI